MRIGEYKVPLYVLNPYVKHVIFRYLKTCQATPDASGTHELEIERERLHNVILEKIGLRRRDPGYKDFESALEAYCESMLPQNNASGMLGKEFHTS